MCFAGEYRCNSADGSLASTAADGTVTTKTLDFAYDASGSPYSLTYSVTGSKGSDSTAAATYYYITNLQGDVLYLVDSTGASVTEYTYDPYGKILRSSGTMADINPLRYRGYYYDSETGFYYLQSCYYDPETCRFISADSYVSTGTGILDYNMFAYCGNDPINRVDSTGEAWWHWAAAGALVLAATAAVVITAGGAAPALFAMASVANGIAVGSTATTVAAGIAIGSGAALTVSAYSAATETNSLEEFAGYGASALVSTAIGGIAGGLAANSMSGHSCFVAGTLIQTRDGAKPIEEIQPGDIVWAWDEKTGDVALKSVVETYVNETKELVHLSVNSENITCTPSHPFYSPARGWTDAVHLRAGDILLLVNGEYVVVEKVQHEILECPAKVYNFQVADYHTYYVSGSGVLVHNRCVAREGKYRADVRIGGDPNHAVGHAHIYEGSDNIASVDANGKVLAGELSRGASKFVQKFLPQIANGINMLYYMIK